MMRSPPKPFPSQVEKEVGDRGVLTFIKRETYHTIEATPFDIKYYIKYLAEGPDGIPDKVFRRLSD